MCGIAGILQFHGKPAEFEKITLMTNAISHRGRDSEGILMGGSGTGPSNISIALGHRRLSIIDLSDSAMQPMVSTSGRFSIVYNGELFNYKELKRELIGLGFRFLTESDTEVVLTSWEAWGVNCLKRFNGMFALAIWDEENQCLHCARDALGVKPFFYLLDRDGFAFSSESRSLATISHGLNPEAITAYFFSMYIPRELSIYKNVQKLLPGNYLQIKADGQSSLTRWWSFPEIATEFLDEDQAVNLLQKALDRGVERQLQSDVPVGAFLSGGFDSGMIVASAAQNIANLHTYSAGFSDGQQFNELPIARSLAARYGTRHHERTITNSEVMSILDKAIACMTEPVADSAVVPTWCLSEMAAADGVKVLLSGTGGDEVFGGYLRYVGHTKRRALMHQLPFSVRNAIGSALPANSSLGARMANHELDMLMFTGGSQRLALASLSPDHSAASLFGRMGDVFAPERLKSNAPLLYKNMVFDLQVYLPDLLLSVLDQITMAHTIEGRVPLLDLDLLSESYSLQANLHASPTQSTTRKLMRLMAKDKLDLHTFSAPKQGFSGPVKPWIEENRGQFRDRTMTLRAIEGLEFLNPELWWTDSKLKNNPAWAHEIFLMYCLATWYEFNRFSR
ncbi:asparagine synthase (glutamine-hydrolyzing) [Polynucleobacter paneuropaeus]|nr:asparagine synthase (glutamine-hydrolyzing) [Polynucleobacter paneuropaeus]